MLLSYERHPKKLDICPTSRGQFSPTFGVRFDPAFLFSAAPHVLRRAFPASHFALAFPISRFLSRSMSRGGSVQAAQKRFRWLIADYAQQLASACVEQDRTGWPEQVETLE